ncbi:unnamed protein product, partial [Mesorhabditis spiculigera]
MWRWRVLLAAALLAPSASASLFLEEKRDVPSDVNDYDSLLRAPQEDYNERLWEQRLLEEENAMQDDEAYHQKLSEIIASLAEQEAESLPEQEPIEAVKQQEQQQPEPEPNQQGEKVEQQQLAEETPVEKPQKKGQSEYVSFVEPEVVSYRQRDVQSLEKRRMAQSIHGNSFSPRGDTNLTMMAVACVLVVGVVGGAVGGIYYRRRKENPDDNEYAPYAGTGPFKRGKRGDKGDDALAYKAQLHHYQQAKQKIICGDEAPGVGIESEDEECADDENNYSVYECPGLAPTGDIEIHNPNFGQQ